MTKEISDTKKALLEATELRNEDKKDNLESISTAEDGRDSVKRAISILKNYYGFVQYKPPLSDRDGNTVDDLATFAPTSEYDGAQAESKGIVGILDVILSDFLRTISTTEDNEKTAQGDFDTLEDTMNKDIDKKSKLLKSTEGRLTVIADELVKAEDDGTDSDKRLQGALAGLAKLKPMCVDGQETYAERVAKRNEEIAALKDALAILEDWQS